MGIGNMFTKIKTGLIEPTAFNRSRVNPKSETRMGDFGFIHLV